MSGLLINEISPISNGEAITLVELRVAVDVSEDVTYGLKLLCFLVWDFDVEFFFESHDELNCVKRVSTKVFDKLSFRLNLVCVYSKLFDDDFCYFF